MTTKNNDALIINSPIRPEQLNGYKDIMGPRTFGEEHKPPVIDTINSIRYDNLVMKPEWDKNKGLKIPCVVQNTPFYFLIPREVVAEILNDLLKPDQNFE